MDELRWTGGLWRVRRAALEKLKIPTGSQGQKMPPYVLQQLFPWHTHAHTLCVSFIALWFIRTQTIICHIWDTCLHTPSWHTLLTVPQKSFVYFDWTSIENTFFPVTEGRSIFSCLYWFRSVTLHCAILHISNTLHKSRHSCPAFRSAIKSRRKKREKWGMDTKQHAVALLIRFAIAKRLR